jgi:hypothetical protein
MSAKLSAHLEAPPLPDLYHRKSPDEGKDRSIKQFEEECHHLSENPLRHQE